jgi:tripartite-type tricarboxylate transporter receptor subunit TctC
MRQYASRRLIGGSRRAQPAPGRRASFGIGTPADRVRDRKRFETEVGRKGDVTTVSAAVNLRAFGRPQLDRVSKFLRFALAASLAATFAVGEAKAQAYPSRPVKLIVPFLAGSATDVTGRLLSERLAEGLGVSFVVENKGGAGGNIGTDIVAKAEPDGYTLAHSATGPLAVNKTLFRKLPYDPERDLAPISLTATLVNVLVVNPKVIPVRNVKEFIQYAKERPGQVNYSSIGNGSSQHLAAVAFEQATGVKLKHVPYRGAPPIVVDLISGDVPVTFQNIPNVSGPLATGQVKALAVTAKTRSKVLPDVPTMQEEGLAGFESYAWFGLVAPKDTPTAIVERLNREVVKALADPVVQKRMIEIGAEPRPSSPSEFKEFISAEVAKWRKVIQDAGITIE